jgi:hypothetical protein
MLEHIESLKREAFGRLDQEDLPTRRAAHVRSEDIKS